MFDVRVYGSAVLRRKARPVEAFDAGFAQFVEELTETMYAKDGVGLAAPQAGKSLRVAVIDTTSREQPPFVLVNPQITWSSPEQEDYEEGCLSVPDIHLTVKRPSRVSVRAQNAQGVEYVIENASGLLARALQHEIDHLDGILFVDRVSPLQRQLIDAKLKKMARESRGTGSGA